MQDFDRGDLTQGTHSDRAGIAERPKWDGEATRGQVAAGSFIVSGTRGTRKEGTTPEPRISGGHENHRWGTWREGLSPAPGTAEVTEPLPKVPPKRTGGRCEVHRLRPPNLRPALPIV